MSSSLLFSVVFSNVNPNNTRKEILFASFCPFKSKVNSFFDIQFSWLLLDILSCGKEII